MRIARTEVLFVACLAACAHSVRTYEGDRRPRREVATLTDSGCAFVVLIVIDDHNRAESEEIPHRWTSYTAEVLPGNHWVTVKWVSAWRQEFAGAAGVAVVTLGVTWALLSTLGGGSPGATSIPSGKKWVPSSIGSLSFRFRAEAGHKYRIRESEGPDAHASKAAKQCWQYLGIVSIEERDPFHLWLVDETALRGAE